MSGMMPLFLNRYVHEFLGPAPTLFTLFFCKVYIILALD